MQISVAGKHMDVGHALQQHVEAKIQEAADKYLDRATDANVVLTKRGHVFHADIVINPGTHSHVVIKSSAEGNDAYLAFDMASEKMEKQLRRYKRKLKDHHQAQTEQERRRLAEMTHYVLQSEEEEVKADNPLVIAEQQDHIDTLTVGAAVMRLDLEDLPVVVFFNSAHGGLNIVYRRPDGNIAWMDPKVSSNEEMLRKAG